jgi:hypothetical protein
MDDLKSFFFWAIEGIITLFFFTISWIWLTDRKEKNERFLLIEERMSIIEFNHIPRPDVEKIVERVEHNFREEHKTIISAVGECNRILREDIALNRKESREDLASIRDDIMNVIERRGKPRE